MPRIFLVNLSLSQAAEIIGTIQSLIKSSTTSFSFLPFLIALFFPKFLARYLQVCQKDEVEPNGKTYFIYHVLAAERVHRSRNNVAIYSNSSKQKENQHPRSNDPEKNVSDTNKNNPFLFHRIPFIPSFPSLPSLSFPPFTFLPFPPLSFPSITLGLILFRFQFQFFQFYWSRGWDPPRESWASPWRSSLGSLGIFFLGARPRIQGSVLRNQSLGSFQKAGRSPPGLGDGRWLWPSPRSPSPQKQRSCPDFSSKAGKHDLSPWR